MICLKDYWLLASRHLLLTLCLLLKQLFEHRALGVFPFIPESKIQTVIVFKLLVVKRMMRGTYQPSTQQIFMKAFRIDLDVQVIDDGTERHDGKVND